MGSVCCHGCDIIEHLIMMLGGGSLSSLSCAADNQFPRSLGFKGDAAWKLLLNDANVTFSSGKLVSQPHQMCSWSPGQAGRLQVYRVDAGWSGKVQSA